MASNNTKRTVAGVLVAGATLLAMLTADEGTVNKPYKDIVGILTVCQGHTGPDIIPGKLYSKAECDAILTKDATAHGLGVLACTKVPLNQNQYDAFTRFTFNVGVSAYCNSSLLKKLNAGDYTGACNGLLAWDKARVNGVMRPVRGLTKRRQSERDLCITPVTPTIIEGVA